MSSWAPAVPQFELRKTFSEVPEKSLNRLFPPTSLLQQVAVRKHFCFPIRRRVEGGKDAQHSAQAPNARKRGRAEVVTRFQKQALSAGYHIRFYQTWQTQNSENTRGNQNNWPPELVDGDREQNSPRVTQEKADSDLPSHLDAHKPVGPS